MVAFGRSWAKFLGIEMADDFKVVDQNVTITFNPRDYLPATYVFEMDDRADYDQTQYGAVRIRKYPSGQFLNDPDIKTVVTEGTLISTWEVREKDVIGSSVVNGDSEVSLPYPVISGLNYYIDGKAYDVYGIERNPTIGFNSKLNKLILSRACYCKVSYSYKTTYQILRYYPNIYNDFEVYYMPDPNDYGQLLGFVHTPPTNSPDSPIVFSIQPPEGIAAEFELYRITSVAFALEEGVWEKPMGWPEDGSYPNSDQTLDSNDNHIQIERTHEIGYFSLLNNPRRMEGKQSSKMDSLPLDFSKELKYQSAAGTTVVGMQTNTQVSGANTVANTLSKTLKVQGKEYFDKYKRLLNNAPKMRSVYYDVAVGEPYGSETAINAAREAVRVVATQSIIDNQGNNQRQQVVENSLKEFRIRLVVKCPSRPNISTSVLRSKGNNDDTDFNIQAQRINTMLSLIWEGIDWAHLRKRILAAYSPDIYQITFDNSFPLN